MNMKLSSIAAALAAAALLAACGGGGGNDLPPLAEQATQVPASAVASSDAYTQYTLAQVSATSETREPLGTDAVTIAPTSDTTEPTPIN